MAVDIFSRSIHRIGEFTMLEAEDELLLLLMQIEMVFSTKKRKVIGASSFGLNLEDMLFTTFIGTEALKNMIYEQIVFFCPLSLKYKVDIEIFFYQGTRRDTAEILVSIDGRNALSVLV